MIKHWCFEGGKAEGGRGRARCISTPSFPSVTKSWPNTVKDLRLYREKKSCARDRVKTKKEEPVGRRMRKR